MASTNTATLDIRLIDDVSAPAKTMAEALKLAESRAKEMEAALAKSNVSDRLASKLKAMGASAGHVQSISKAYDDLAKREGIALKQGIKLTADQAAAVKNWEAITVSSVRAVMGQERALEAARVQSVSKAQTLFRQEADSRIREAQRETTALTRVRDRERDHFRSHIRGMMSEAAAATGIMGGMYGAVRVGEHAVRAGADYNTEIQNLKDAGPRASAYLPQAIAEAQRVATAVPGTTPAENLRTANEMRMAFGGMKESLANLQLIQEASQAVKIASAGKSTPAAEEMGQAFAKVFEMRGVAMDSDKFRDQAGQVVQSMVATRGRFTPEDLLQYAQRAGRGATSNLSTRYLSQVVPTIVGDLGSADQAGTQQRALRQIAMGHLSSKTQVEEWEKLGLVDKSKVHKKGMSPGWEAGAVVNTNLLLSDPDKWVEKYLLPAMKGEGVNLMDPLAVSKAVGAIAPKGTAQNLLETLTQYQSRRQLHADAQQYVDAHGAKQIIADHARLDPTQGVKDVNAGIEGLFSTLTSPMMPAIGAGLKYLQDRINDLNNAAKNSPVVRDATIAAGVAATAGAVGVGTKVTGAVVRRLISGPGRSPTGPAAPEGASTAEVVAKVAEASKGGGLGAAAIDVGTLGLLAWWSSISDIGNKKLSPESLKSNPLGITLPGESDFGAMSPADAADRAKDRQDTIDKSATDMLWQFGKLDTSADRLQATLASLDDAAASAASAISGMGGGGGGGGGGFINAAYTTYGSGGGGGGGGGASGIGASRGAAGNFSGSISDGSAVDRALGMTGVREHQAANALGHMMHAGEWCADFVNGVIAKSGGRGSGSAMARSFMNWGTAVGLSQIKKNDVAVLNHGGHVGLFTGERDANGRLGVVAGNTRDGHGGHAVRHYFVSPGSIYGARRGGSNPTLPRRSSGAITAMNDDLTPAVDLQHLARGVELTREMKGHLSDINKMSAPHSRVIKPGMIRTASNRLFAGASRIG